jgi:hypothetical protein
VQDEISALWRAGFGQHHHLVAEPDICHWQTLMLGSGRIETVLPLGSGKRSTAAGREGCDAQGTSQELQRGFGDDFGVIGMKVGGQKSSCGQ